MHIETIYEYLLVCDIVGNGGNNFPDCYICSVAKYIIAQFIARANTTGGRGYILYKYAILQSELLLVIIKVNS